MANNTRLHIFPEYGSWKMQTNNVFMLTTVGDLPLSTAYDFQAAAARGCLADRDNVFEVLAISEFRAHYDDVIYYSSPFAMSWCNSCDGPRYFLQRDGLDYCDNCYAEIEPPF